MTTYRIHLPALLAFDVAADTEEVALEEARRVAGEIWEEGLPVTVPLPNASDSRVFVTVEVPDADVITPDGI
jgi:hypothetical protein